MEKYYLQAPFKPEWVEVTKEEFCRAERAAGFRPKMWSGDPRYMTTPATGGFYCSGGVSGRVEYLPYVLREKNPAMDEALAKINGSPRYDVKNIEQSLRAKVDALLEHGNVEW